MRDGRVALLLVLLLALSGLTGCLGQDGDSGDQEPPEQVAAPQWEIGQWWDYSYTIPEEQNQGFRLVVAANDGTNYWLAADSEHAAEYHAVLNFNPMLGRVNIHDFSIFEKGLQQKLFDFPLTRHKTWSFALLEREGTSIQWSAKVTKIERADELVDQRRYPTVLVYVEATGDGGELLRYLFDTRAGWLRSFQMEDAGGESLVSLDLTGKGYGTGHSGLVHFVRAKDLFDHRYQVTNSAQVDRSDNFTDNGHPTAGDFDRYIYYLQFSTEPDSHATVEVKDRDGNEGYRKAIGEDQHGADQGTIAVVSGEWEVTVSMEGTVDLHLRIAGGIYYQWDLA